ncbi:AI-2E family transporter [Stenotrophobium rhamnosiphilum]|uniref:AI-2E family transporter n=1 Tax=Stenotrophobium rhamnosiphilum TaxID=2029166 RepID=A0A2T5MJX9_9GAMM|nr:AI-2E family transporter [Stenotrophobium rhamnosiphilum]PTU32875.1 AI-2E family transporter [Stenotrophobium rhamnosiphilum]
MNFKEHMPWWIFGALALGLLWLLSPILMPFVVGISLAYIGNPVINNLQRRGMSRGLGVSVVFIVITLLTALFFVLVIPPLEEQLYTLITNIPDALHWIQDTALPALGIRLPRGVQLDADGVRKLIAANWGTASDMAMQVWHKVSTSGMAAFTLIANLTLIPVVGFYMMRDWNLFVGAINDLIPPRLHTRVNGFMNEADAVLAAFFRGQLMVMASLAAIYSIGLSIVGLKLALVIGIGAGLVSFVPYLGAISGFVAAIVAILVQTGDPWQCGWVGLVFFIGQMAEGSFLTPNLVGDRIGLHPVTVIFAVMAGGTLFGFVGVLLALPAAAVLAVAARHLLEQWRKSRLYLGSPALPSPEQTPE